MIIDQVIMAVETIEDAHCEVRLTFDPQWTPTMLRQEAIEVLGTEHPLAQMARGV
jgi:metal-sulfur cluster biosynthetic enzyme